MGRGWRYGSGSDCLLQLPQGTFHLSQHGFARQMPWQLEALADGAGVRLQLSESTETLQAYPFVFHLNLEARLDVGALALATTLSNRSAAPMPFSFGLHVYFNVSSLKGLRFEGLPSDCLNHLTMQPDATVDQLRRLEQGIDLLARPSGAVRLVDRAAAVDGLPGALERAAPGVAERRPQT